MNTSLLVWIILAPLIGAILNGAFYFYHIKKKPVPEMVFSIIGTGTPLISFFNYFYSLFIDMVNTGNTYKTSSIYLVEY